MRITIANAEDIDELEPLWQAMAAHHQQMAPHFGKPRSLEDSWSRRREQYAEWLADPDTYLLIAETEDQPPRAIGYALARPLAPSHSWDDGPRMVLESLSVLPEFRSRGVGTRLLEQIKIEARARGMRQLVLEVIASNPDAIAFYQRAGLHPRLLTLAQDLES